MGKIGTKEEFAVDSLKSVKTIFDDLGIEFWLEAGTLLGAVRDGKILEWDLDIDLAMWYDDVTKLFQAFDQFKKRKIEVKSVSTLYPHAQNVKLMFPGVGDDNIMIDIELWENKGDNLVFEWEGPGTWTLTPVGLRLFLYALRIVRHFLCTDIGVYVPGIGYEERPVFQRFANTLERISPFLPLKLKMFFLNLMQNRQFGQVNWAYIMPKHYFGGFEFKEFYGMTIKIPSNVENYLKYHYGENWKIPKKNWNWQKDDTAQNYFKVK